ncbi:MAG: hypothetical protein ACC662_11040, partial [Planctomycetota bacterium]
LRIGLVAGELSGDRLGAWQKAGGRWVIPREAFFRFWEDQVQDGVLPSPADEVGGADVEDAGIERYHLGS